jgi:hypothetical protein
VIEPELDQVLGAIEGRIAANEARVLVMRPPERKVANNPF